MTWVIHAATGIWSEHSYHRLDQLWQFIPGMNFDRKNKQVSSPPYQYQ